MQEMTDLSSWKEVFWVVRENTSSILRTKGDLEKKIFRKIYFRNKAKVWVRFIENRVKEVIRLTEEMLLGTDSE